jgi:hypothetical protein
MSVDDAVEELTAWAVSWIRDEDKCRKAKND